MIHDTYTFQDLSEVCYHLHRRIQKRQRGVAGRFLQHLRRAGCQL